MTALVSRLETACVSRSASAASTVQAASPAYPARMGVRHEFDSHAVADCEALVGLDDLFDQRRDVHLLQYEFDLAAFQLLDIEDVVDKTHQPLTVGVRDRDEAGDRFGQQAIGLSHQKPQRSCDRRQRGTQFVAHRGDEFILQPFEPFALRRITQCPDEAARFDLPLDKKVLCAFLKRLRRDILVIHPRQHDQRNSRRGCAGSLDCSYTLRVGQVKIEEDHVECGVGDMPLGFRHVGCEDQIDIVLAVFAQHFAKQPRVAGIVFDNQQCLDRTGFHRSASNRGNWTLVSQKSLMLLTRLSNSSSCTGLLK